MEEERRPVAYPYVVVRIGCELCKRSGQYRLARLAARFGPEIELDELLVVDCEAMRAKHPYRQRCAARFIDLDPPRRPPDAPRVAMKLIIGGRQR